jgi:outer membrane biosynthesis protein TonB
MSELSTDDVAARVVAWHNRNPLARRLRPADVGSVGHVALPFFDPDAPPPAGWEAPAGSLLARAMARARAGLPRPRGRGTAGSLRAAFREDFIPPLRPDEVAALAARHGVERDDEPVDAPVRIVMPPPGTEALAWRWVLTAELRTDTARTRVLLGPRRGAPVLGRRLLSLPRVVALAALGGAALTLAVTLGVFESGEPAPVAVLPGAAPSAAGPASAPAAPAASAAAAEPAAAPAVPPLANEPRASAPAAATPTPTPTPAPAPAPAPAPPPKPAPAPAPVTAPAAPAAGASRPLDVEPRLGRVELPAVPSIVDLRRRRAAEQAAAAASAASAAAPAPAAAPAANAPAFALATRLLRTRTESEQIAEALAALLVVPGSPVQKVEVIKIGDDFRVVAWPYPSRAAAERAQAALLARGHRLQLIDF